ncbi:MAG: NAD(P)/FAD-dependent oxidoreductase [Burkholderiaceae bacterium]
MSTEDKYALIGAGPSGLAMARNLQKHAISFDAFEAWTDVGGRSNPAHPATTAHRGSHTIVSRDVLQFADYPMPGGTPDFPSHALLAAYLDDFARQFGLRDYYRFGARVVRVEPQDGGWGVGVDTGDGQVETKPYRGVIIATGRQGRPNWPTLNGRFDGTFVHANDYRDARAFADQRVLVIGGANRGCEVAVDLVPHAASVDLSMRRGYYFVPSYLFGRPVDTLTRRRAILPGLMRPVDARVLKWFGGDAQRFGLPRPDYAIHELPPVINAMVPHHIGHGALKVRADVEGVDGRRVTFAGGETGEYDAIICATGSRLDYPFIDADVLNWQGSAPQLFVHILPPRHDELFVIGMATGEAMGWQVKHEQAEFVARTIRARRASPEFAAALRARVLGNWPDLSGGYRFLPQPRMACHVDTPAYRGVLAGLIAETNIG